MASSGNLQNPIEQQPLLQGSGSRRFERVGFFHPTRAFFRYSVLVVIALICFGSYFVYDEIQPFESDINNRLNGNAFMFQVLYAVYSFPNIILVFFGGALADKIGLRRSGLIFMSLVLIGAILVALGMSFAGPVVSPTFGYVIVVAGRFIFGCGAETLNVIQTSMVTLWFKGGRELAFAMGLTLSASRLGDYISIALTNTISDIFGSFLYAMWAGALMAGISMVATILYCIADKYAETKVERTVTTGENDFDLTVVKYFDVRFWIIAFLCMTYYSGVLPFVAIASDFLEDEYNLSDNAAGWYSSTIILAAMILSPILGKLIDIVGYRPYFVILGSALIIPAHLILYFKFTHFIPAIIPMIMIGLSFSIVPSTLWPSVPLLTKEKETSTAFGMMTAIQNGGLTVTNLISGQIIDSFGNRQAMLFFVCMDVLGFLLGWLLIVVDKKKGAILCRINPIQSHQAEFTAPINEEEKDYD